MALQGGQQAPQEFSAPTAAAALHHFRSRKHTQRRALGIHLQQLLVTATATATAAAAAAAAIATVTTAAWGFQVRGGIRVRVPRHEGRNARNGSAQVGQR